MTIINLTNIYIMDFNDFYWHDSELERIFIDRTRINGDVIQMDVVWYDTNQRDTIYFKRVYWANFNMNFGHSGIETIDSANTEGRDNELVQNILSNWKGRFNNLELNYYEIITNSGSKIQIVATGFDIKQAIEPKPDEAYNQMIANAQEITSSHPTPPSMTMLNKIKRWIAPHKIVVDGLKTVADLIVDSKHIAHFSPDFNGHADMVYSVTLVNRYKIYRYSDKYVVEHKLNTNLVFSINKPAKVCGMNHLLLKEGASNIYISKGGTDLECVKQSLPYFSDLLKFMKNTKGSAVSVYRNGIVFSADKQVDLRAVLDELNRIIPLIKVEKESEREFDPSTPTELRGVLDLAYEFEISDDCERDEIQSLLNSDQKRRIISIVEPKIDLINSYLDSFGDRAMSEDAQMIGDVAQFYDEIRLE